MDMEMADEWQCRHRLTKAGNLAPFYVAALRLFNFKENGKGKGSIYLKVANLMDEKLTVSMI